MRTQYEYRYEMDVPKVTVAWLNQIGAEGWQLVKCDSRSFGTIEKGRHTVRTVWTCIFMREKEEHIDPDEVLGVGSAGDPI